MTVTEDQRNSWPIRSPDPLTGRLDVETDAGGDDNVFLLLLFKLEKHNHKFASAKSIRVQTRPGGLGRVGSWETYPVEKAFDNRGPGIGSLLLIFHYRPRRGGHRARARDVFNDRFDHYGLR